MGWDSSEEEKKICIQIECDAVNHAVKGSLITGFI